MGGSFNENGNARNGLFGFFVEHLALQGGIDGGLTLLGLRKKWRKNEAEAN
jgi:hypothetical protein